MQKKPRRITTHPKMTPEAIKASNKLAEQEEEFLNSKEGKQVLDDVRVRLESSHGGRREGAGRKKSATVPVSYKIDPDVAEFLSATGKAGAVVSECVRRSKGFRDWMSNQQ